MAIYDFKSNFDKSNNDSYIVMEYFKLQGYVCEDYSTDMKKQIEDGIDFGIKKNQPEFQTVEFKSCSRINKTNNIAYEMIGNFLNRKLGSCMTTKANLLFYYDNRGYILHTFDLKKLDVCINRSHKSKWEIAKASTYTKTGDVYSSFSLLVPVQFLIDNQEEIKYKTFDLNNFINEKQKQKKEKLETDWTS